MAARQSQELTGEVHAPALVIRLGGLRCALPLRAVIETMRPLPIEPFAGAPTGVLGAAIIRGAPTVVVDLGMVIGHATARPTRFVTVRTGARTVALAVDAVEGVREVPRGALEALPPLLGDPATAAVEAVGTRDAELLVLLRTARLVPEELA